MNGEGRKHVGRSPNSRSSMQMKLYSGLLQAEGTFDSPDGPVAPTREGRKGLTFCVSGTTSQGFEVDFDKHIII